MVKIRGEIQGAGKGVILLYWMKLCLAMVAIYKIDQYFNQGRSVKCLLGGAKLKFFQSIYNKDLVREGQHPHPITFLVGFQLLWNPVRSFQHISFCVFLVREGKYIWKEILFNHQLCWKKALEISHPVNNLVWWNKNKTF